MSPISVFSLAVAGSPIFAAGIYIFYKLVNGIYEPVRDTYINSIINNKFRATILSIYSMAASFGEVISGIGIGAVAEIFGLSVAFYISCAGLVVVALLLLYINVFIAHAPELAKN